MIHSTRPAAASAKCPKIRAGWKRLDRCPPRASHVPSNTNPPPAVTIQAISAAMDMTYLLVCVAGMADRPALAGLPEPLCLDGLGGHPNAEVVGQLSAQVPGHGQGGQADR